MTSIRALELRYGRELAQRPFCEQFSTMSIAGKS